MQKKSKKQHSKNHGVLNLWPLYTYTSINSPVWLSVMELYNKAHRNKTMKTFLQGFERLPLLIGATHVEETSTRNLHRTERSSIRCQVSGTAILQTQLNNQTAQFW